MITSIKLFETSMAFLRKAWTESSNEEGETNFDKFFDAIGQMDPVVRKQLKSFWDLPIKGTDPNNEINPEWHKLGDADPYFAYLNQAGIKASR